MIVEYENSLVVCQTRSGWYKVYVMGHADGHMMDWRGCNYRYVPITGQPFRGFINLGDAKDYMDRVRKNKARLKSENERAKSKAGQWIPDDRFIG